MTWTTDTFVATATQTGKKIKGSLIRLIHANVAAAFAGDSGAPDLAKAVSQKSLATHGFNELGTYALVTKTTASAGLPYTNGATVAGADFSLTGTWRVMGQVEIVAFSDGESPTSGRYSVLLLRTA